MTFVIGGEHFAVCETGCVNFAASFGDRYRNRYRADGLFCTAFRRIHDTQRIGTGSTRLTA